MIGTGLTYYGYYNYNNKIQQKKFYFVRHGITDWDISLLPDGPLNLHLNQNGIDDITQKPDELILKHGVHPKIILTSPLTRCRETAKIFQDKHDSALILECSELQEIYRGDWSIEHSNAIKTILKDATLKQKENNWSQEKKTAYIFVEIGKLQQPKDAEKWSDFKDRVKNVERIIHTQPNETLIISHGVVIKEFLKYLYQQKSEEEQKKIQELLGKWRAYGNNRPLIILTIDNNEQINIKLDE